MNVTVSHQQEGQTLSLSNLVILSAAKYLAADRDRPFAACTLSAANGLRRDTW